VQIATRLARNLVNAPDFLADALKAWQRDNGCEAQCSQGTEAIEKSADLTRALSDGMHIEKKRLLVSGFARLWLWSERRCIKNTSVE
jgi:hypothetical protein